MIAPPGRRRARHYDVRMSALRRLTRARNHASTPLRAAALVLGALLVVVAWATASPPGSSPDEDFHLTSIWCPTPLGRACETKIGPDGYTAVQAPQMVISSAVCTAFHPENSGACVKTLTTDPTWSNRLDDGQYPGGFYDVMHVFVGDDVARSVTIMRVVNGLLAIVLFAAVTMLSPPEGRRALVYGHLTVAVPMAVYLIASVNPSSWAITGVAVAWAALHGYLTQPERRRRVGLAALAVGAAVVAATARADAGAFLGVIAVGAVALHFTAVRGRLRLAALPTAVAVIGAAGFASASQAGAVTSGMGGYAQLGDRALLISNIKGLPQLLLGSQMDPLNWVDTPVPAITWVPIVLVIAALAFLGLRVTDVPKRVALLGLVGVYAALPLLLLQLSGAHVGTEVQARYLTPLLPAIMTAALWDPVRRGIPRLSRPQTVLAYAAMVVGHSAVLHTQIRRYVTGLDVGGVNLNDAVEWWGSPVSPVATWILGSFGFAALAVALFLVARPERSEPATVAAHA
ncbi:putative membrane protein DUF2142 [Xylanimonas ulmi]|uniref:Putative membrane protein DUF2142 n=2 Tax=Xylanimonas ulmi TaxID=228973 RepID=A0A4Q7M087_9MICO|nr:putative membrane protein DUF2142 [Xylanibacterium ulmi]